MVRTWVLFALALSLHGFAPATAASASPTTLATYVPLCKNSRGQLDRRACRGKPDGARLQLATVAPFKVGPA